MRSAQVDKLCVRETKVLQAMQNDETVQHEATHTCFVPRPIESIQSNPQPTPLGISFVWQTWKQTQLISYQSNFSAYASNLHVINLCDKVKCRTVDTGCFGGVVREDLHFFLFCIVRLTVVKWFATWLLYLSRSLSLSPYMPNCWKIWFVCISKICVSAWTGRDHLYWCLKQD